MDCVNIQAGLSVVLACGCFSAEEDDNPLVPLSSWYLRAHRVPSAASHRGRVHAAPSEIGLCLKQKPPFPSAWPRRRRSARHLRCNRLSHEVYLQNILDKYVGGWCNRSASRIRRVDQFGCFLSIGLQIFWMISDIPIRYILLSPSYMTVPLLKFHVDL